MKKIWSKNGSVSVAWQTGNVEFELEPPHVILFFEAETVDWKYGDIALDNFEYTHGECSRKLKPKLFKNKKESFFFPQSRQV